MDGFTERPATYGQMNLLFAIRNQWRDQAIWTRSYLIGRFAGLDISEDIYRRLYRVPQNLGNIMQFIFGYENATKYAQLLSLQVASVRSLIDAQIAGDASLVNQYVHRLYQIADERAKFMNTINPFWDETSARSLIYTYLQYTFEEITTLLTGQYSRNIDIFDMLLNHSDIMGDYFAQGLYTYLTYSDQDGAIDMQQTNQ